MKSVLLNCACLCWLAACLTAAEPTTIWREHVAAVESGAEPPLPDFSYAGYAYGEKRIPDEFDLPVFRVVDFGANPDDALLSASFDNHGANFKDLPNHLDGLVYWNFEVTDDPLENFDFWDLLADEPDRAYGPLTAIDPIVVGLHGSEITFAPDSIGRLESLGQPVIPESLYEAQLELRLGRRPGWIDEARAQWAAMRQEFYNGSGGPDIISTVSSGWPP